MGGGRDAAVITVLLPAGAVESSGGSAPPHGGRAPLDDVEQHHLRVRRARAGERVAIRDGAGLVGTGHLALTGKAWEVEIEAAERSPRPAALTLAVGAGDRERFGWVVEKAAELGVTRVVPLMTARSRDVANRVRDGHVEKLRRLALEATKQCGAAWAVEVTGPAALQQVIEEVTADAPVAGTRCWLADAAGSSPPSSLDGAPVIVVVGPEGGLEDDERRAALTAGFRSLALSAYTLRFETAALAAAVVVSAARLRGIHG